MSFKKTPDGRVFFQGSNDSKSRQEKTGTDAKKAKVPTSANDAHASNFITPPPSQKSLSSLEVVALLRSLNQKLKVTQQERDIMRKELDDYKRDMDAMRDEISSVRKTATPDDTAKRTLASLEHKAGQAEKNILALRQHIANTAQVQESLSERQKNFADQLEENLQARIKIAEQVEKANEDRKIFLAKMESIETAIINSQEAIARKVQALVEGASNANLLQSYAEPSAPAIKARVASDYTEDTIEQEKHNSGDKTFWLATALVTVAAIVLFAVMVNTVYNENENGTQIIDSSFNEASLFDTPATNAEVYSSSDVQAFDPAFNIQNETQNTSLYFPSGENSEPEQPSSGLPDETGEAQSQDIFTDNNFEQDFETDADALAEKLNALEPQAANPTADTSEQEAPTPELKAAVNKSALPSDIHYLEQSAINGNPQAQHDLATLYIAGTKGITRDYSKAVYWFEKAAEQNIANASYNLGVLYHRGLGTDQNLEKAMQFYKQAADQGHPDAQYNLGIAYIEGIGVSYDPQIAADYFDLASRQNVNEAAYNLGLIYENGLLGKSEPQKALMYYKRATEAGNADAKTAFENLAMTLNISLEEANAIASGNTDFDTPSNYVAPAQKITPSQTPSIQPLSKDSSGNEIPEPFTPDTVKKQMITAQIQEELMKRGYFPGPADGFLSPMTADAIRVYQEENDLIITGDSDQALLAHLVRTRI